MKNKHDRTTDMVIQLESASAMISYCDTACYVYAYKTNDHVIQWAEDPVGLIETAIITIKKLTLQRLGHVVSHGLNQSCLARYPVRKVGRQTLMWCDNLQ